MSNVIRPHLIKPRIERLIYEKLDPPANGVMVNIRPVDQMDIRKTREDLVTVVFERKLLVEPESLMKLVVTMAVDIPVDGIEFSKLDDPKAFIKTSQPVRTLIGYVSNMISTITMHSGIGPIVTPPEEQI